jgi:hypothetical protein
MVSSIVPDFVSGRGRMGQLLSSNVMGAGAVESSISINKAMEGARTAHLRDDRKSAKAALLVSVGEDSSNDDWWQAQNAPKPGAILRWLDT